MDGRTIQNRKRRLMAIQRKIARARNRKLVGQELPVLVEGLSKETDLLWEGRMPTQAPEIDGVTLINDFEGDEPRQGEIRRLRITEAHDYDVVGTLLPPTETRPAFRARAAHQHRAYDLKCPICKKEEAEARRPGFPVLQRALPAHRPGQLGLGEVRDFDAGQPAEPETSRTMSTTDDVTAGARPDRHLVRLPAISPSRPGTAGSLRARHRDCVLLRYARLRVRGISRCSRSSLFGPAVWAADVTARRRSNERTRAWS